MEAWRRDALIRELKPAFNRLIRASISALFGKLLEPYVILDMMTSKGGPLESHWKGFPSDSVSLGPGQSSVTVTICNHQEKP